MPARRTPSVGPTHVSFQQLMFLTFICLPISPFFPTCSRERFSSGFVHCEMFGSYFTRSLICQSVVERDFAHASSMQCTSSGCAENTKRMRHTGAREKGLQPRRKNAHRWIFTSCGKKKRTHVSPLGFQVVRFPLLGSRC